MPADVVACANEYESQTILKSTPVLYFVQLPLLYEAQMPHRLSKIPKRKLGGFSLLFCSSILGLFLPSEEFMVVFGCVCGSGGGVLLPPCSSVCPCGGGVVPAPPPPTSPPPPSPPPPLGAKFTGSPSSGAGSGSPIGGLSITLYLFGKIDFQYSPRRKSTPFIFSKSPEPL